MPPNTSGESSNLEMLRALMLREDDIKQVLELVELPDGRFRYLIETPFETFPKFVIGSTDATFKAIRLEHRCGAEWNARRIWNGEKEEAGS